LCCDILIAITSDKWRIIFLVCFHYELASKSLLNLKNSDDQQIKFAYKSLLYRLIKRAKFLLILSPDIKMVVAIFFDLAANCKDSVDSNRNPLLTLSEATELYLQQYVQYIGEAMPHLLWVYRSLRRNGNLQNFSITLLYIAVCTKGITSCTA